MIVMRMGSGLAGGGILRCPLFSSRSAVFCTERISLSPCDGQKLCSSGYKVLQLGHSFIGVLRAAQELYNARSQKSGARSQNIEDRTRKTQKVGRSGGGSRLPYSF